MIKPRRIGHATFETPDLEKAIAYYTEMMGLVLAAREKDRAYLASKIGLLTIALQQAGAERCTRLAFEVAPGEDFADLGRKLAADGVSSELRNDSRSPASARCCRLRTARAPPSSCSSNGAISASTSRCPASGRSSSAMSPSWCRTSTPPSRSTQKVLGFKVSDWIGDFFVFMRCNPDHHTVNFIKGQNIKLHHMAFELKDFIHIQNSCDLFGQRNVPIIWGPLRQGPGHNIATYHRNHDDQVIELYTELDQMKDDELGYFDPRPWHRDQPQRPKVWEPGKTNTWGTPPTPDFHRDRL